jgi:hypothetical protein
MTTTTILPPAASAQAAAADPTAVAGAFKVDAFRGETSGRVSSEWFRRPDDQRYLNLADLHAATVRRATGAHVQVIEASAVRVEAKRDDPEKLGLMLPGSEELLEPTHWSFGQLASLVQAPASYLRRLPAPLAGINLQYGLSNHRAEMVKTLEAADGRLELRAVTGPDYGRVWDHELVQAVRRIAGNGTGDTRWKVPGQMQWSEGTYNPFVDVTKETTTLYASDRDVFLFLVDDTHPIEAGTLPDGSPDLFFRGFYAWNSEVGSRALGIATFYLRAVCQNRCLWGIEGFEEIKLRHSKFAADRFAREAAPALTSFADAATGRFVKGIATARATVVARNKEERVDFLERRGFSGAEASRVIATVLREEGREPESIFDFVQGITAMARTRTHQDGRLELEGKAKRLLDKVAA